MSKLQHTKGPWVKDYNNTVGHIKTLCDPDVHTKTIIKYRYNMCEEILTEEEIEANARLIAAAPEMLIELLKSIAELDKTGFASITSETIIMKATGWSYDILNDVLTKLSTGMSIEEILK
jgi:hypothetical protein